MAYPFYFTLCLVIVTFSHYVFYSIATFDVEYMLGDSKNNSNGIVTMYHPSFGWRKVCWPNWYDRHSRVLCRHLGYTGVRDTSVRRDFSRPPGIDLYDVQCTGSESSMWDCAKNEWRKVSPCPNDYLVLLSCS